MPFVTAEIWLAILPAPFSGQATRWHFIGGHLFVWYGMLWYGMVVICLLGMVWFVCYGMVWWSSVDQRDANSGGHSNVMGHIQKKFNCCRRNIFKAEMSVNIFTANS